MPDELLATTCVVPYRARIIRVVSWMTLKKSMLRNIQHNSTEVAVRIVQKANIRTITVRLIFEKLD